MTLQILATWVYVDHDAPANRQKDMEIPYLTN